MNPHGSYIVPAIVKHASTNQQPGDMMSSYSIIQDVFFCSRGKLTNKRIWIKTWISTQLVQTRQFEASDIFVNLFLHEGLFFLKQL